MSKDIKWIKPDIDYRDQSSEIPEIPHSDLTRLTQALFLLYQEQPLNQQKIENNVKILKACSVNLTPEDCLHPAFAEAFDSQKGWPPQMQETMRPIIRTMYEKFQNDPEQLNRSNIARWALLAQDHDLIETLLERDPPIDLCQPGARSQGFLVDLFYLPASYDLEKMLSHFNKIAEKRPEVLKRYIEKNPKILGQALVSLSQNVSATGVDRCLAHYEPHMPFLADHFSDKPEFFFGPIMNIFPVFQDSMVKETIYGPLLQSLKTHENIPDLISMCINIDGFNALLFKNNPELYKELITEHADALKDNIGIEKFQSFKIFYHAHSHENPKNLKASDDALHEKKQETAPSTPATSSVATSAAPAMPEKKERTWSQKFTHKLSEFFGRSTAKPTQKTEEMVEKTDQHSPKKSFVERLKAMRQIFTGHQK